VEWAMKVQEVILKHSHPITRPELGKCVAFPR
jgi:hypothetical protein